MNDLFLVIAIILAILILFPLYRLINGPTIFDRIISAGLMGTNGILLLVTLGFFYERIDMLIDLAIAYALLNFIGTIAVSKFIEKHRGEA
ncbi:monovalent cation/H+ antiporter complex subunit F [Chloroflexota bacterium]